MKAAHQSRYGDPLDVIRIEEVDRPRARKGRVVIEVVAAATNWADWSMTVGEPYLMRLGYGFRGPRQGVRGMDVAGRVVEVGPGVDGFEVGDEVFGWCQGALAEFVAVKDTQLVPKPPWMAFEDAAGMVMAGCVALQALRDIAAVEVGDRVLVNGASGGIGSFAVQIASSLGAHVTGVCSTSNVEFVESLGADRVIDYTVEDFTTGEEQYDVILDQADNRSLRRRRAVLTERGTLIPNSGVGGKWFGSVGRILRARLVSPFVRHRLRPFLSISRRDDLLELCSLVERGEVRTVVGRTYSLEDAGQAIAAAGSGHARGKIIVRVD